MSGTAAYPFKIKKAGTSTAFTGEAMSGSAGLYQIDDANKQVFDRTVTPTFYDNGVSVPDYGIISIDYLYGRIKFAQPIIGPVTVDGSYLPMADIAGAKECSINRTCAIYDDTDISNVGYHTKKYGIQDVSITASRFDDVSHDFTTIMENRSVVVIELAPDTNKSYRGFFVISDSDASVDINALLEESLTFELDGDDEIGKTFSRSDRW
jgi:hypothetical protein